MIVIIESTLSGSASGYLNCNILGHETAGTLIATYCESKLIPHNPNFVLLDQNGIRLDCNKTLEESGIRNGDILYLEKQGEIGGIFTFTNWWIIAAGALLVACGGFATVLSLHLTEGPTPIGYGIVLDGGSTHTSVYVYQWDGPKFSGTGVLQQVDSCYIEGDVAGLYRNISAISPFLEPCLSRARSRVPSVARPSTPIYFGATAGLRLLNISQPSASDVLLDGIRNVLSQSGFAFQRSNVEILTGGEEARFSWVTVNAQLKTLGPSRLFRRSAPPPSGSPETIGALDLGGASTQISMEVGASDGDGSDRKERRRSLRRREEIGASPEAFRQWRGDEDPVSSLGLYGRNYSVYSQSSLCYGVMEVVRRYQAMIIRDHVTSDSVVASPCHPTGYAENVTTDQVFGSPCTKSQPDPAIGRHVTSNLSGSTVTLNGTSRPEECSAYIERLFNATYCQSQFLPYTCFANEARPPLADQQFLAFSSFYFTAMDLNITNGSSLAEFRKSVVDLCSMSWDEVSSLPLIVPFTTFRPMLCTEAQLVLSLLTSGYGFDDKSWEGIHFVHRISDTDVGWSMGYMTERTNAIAASLAQPLLLVAPFVALAILFGLFLVVGVVLSHHALRIRRSAQSYTRLQRSPTYGSLAMSL